MANKEKSKKKVVVTTEKRDNLRPTASKLMSSSAAKAVETQSTLLYSKEHYKWMIIGFVVILLGMFLMMGGRNPSSEIWDEGIIYSARRTVLAPIVILAGLIIEIFAILKHK